MARNAEKAMTSLARFRAAQMEDKGFERKTRPLLASQCNDLSDAERFRRDIVRQIHKKVTMIQNAGLGDFKIRDLNDQINRLLREKRQWEIRIKELGGNVLQETGSTGYKYFGAAKDLPGVRTLFTKTEKKVKLTQDIDAKYYGYRDEDDGVVVDLEREEERKINFHSVQETEEDSVQHDEDSEQFSGQFVSHVPSVPNQKQVQEELLRRKKEQLMQQYLPGDSVS